MSKKLKSTDEVISVLGGPLAVAELFDLTESAVSNWRLTNQFPGYTFPTLTTELSSRSLSADLALWNFGRKQSARRLQREIGAQ